MKQQTLEVPMKASPESRIAFLRRGIAVSEHFIRSHEESIARSRADIARLQSRIREIEETELF